MKRIAFFVSGSGTNMANLVARIKAGEIRAEATLVVSNKPGVKALERAKECGVPSEVISHEDFATREAFDAALAECVDKYRIDLICLCGFMRVLTPGFVRKYHGRLINIHPALLPAFPGAHGIRDAWDARVRETGVTVHFVDDGVDTGPIILQRKVPVLPTDTLETLEARIHAAEYEVYPEALRLVIEGKLQV
ncbi:MAG TPA: phosphoribosylglycinamide formyltransferase [Candidatus Omnitrophota bacterium]|jgi:formyltetrahydrofolate-dependent phosphoribosylglycinamide formyltransferase|nr:MAG: Phosphoribosylglycinamide formyltransferase [Candidatus Omnitrophica bacterium ADurb.Bin314]HOE68230.1 phosphoribosylglycinamide formyltransferase [Candidatus Omnitrophota bacterium]HQB94113.1 phosphoribosylglycinamide formyltransferase [Candidatus Omnitrophota bacterium]